MATVQQNQHVNDPNRAQQYQANNYPQAFVQQAQYQNQYQQPQQNAPMNQYPQGVPQELMQANQQHAKQQQEGAENSALSCIPALRGKTDRQNFVIKVYSIIFVMLSVTVIFTTAMVTDALGDSKQFVINNTGLYFFSLFMVIAIMIGMVCFYKKFRRYPLNYIALGTYTMFHTYLVGAMSCFYEPSTVLQAAVATMVMFISLTTYAVFTKTDMTKYGGLMYVGTSMLVFFIIVISLFKVPSILGVVLTCVMICLLSVWVVYDTQIIVGGKKYDELSMDDYCLGALIIYSDIVTIFMYILQLCGS